MLERVPGLTPMQVREALRMTADRAGSPDNDFGWGIIDAWAAAIRPETVCVHTETIGNPRGQVTDLPAVAEIAHVLGQLGAARIPDPEPRHRQHRRAPLN